MRTPRPKIAEIFEDLATEVTLELEVSPVFLNLNPDVTRFPNISESRENSR